MKKTTILRLFAAALSITFVLLASSCGLSDLFGKAGVTMAPAVTTTVPETVVTDPIPTINASPVDFSTLDLDSYIELDYKNMKLTSSVEIRELTDAVVESELTSILLYYDYYTLDTSRQTAEGDTIEMEYTGYMDGEEFSGGKSDKATILLDEANSGYIAGFAAGLIGQPCDTEIDLNLTFPENYYADLAGKAVVFKVKIHGICTPDTSDKNAILLSSGAQSTMDEYRAYLKEYLAELDDYRRFNDVAQTISEKLSEIAVFKQEPAAQAEYYYQYYMNTIGSSAASYGMTIAEYMSRIDVTDEQVKADAKEAARQDLVFAYVTQKENITLTDEMYQDYLDRLVTSYRNQGANYTAAQIEGMYASYYGANYLKDAARDESVIYAVYGYADIEYVPATAAE